MFLKNAWYVAGWDRQIGTTPFARTILNEPVVLFRREDGTPVALEDRCCHRQYPLSKGVVSGGNIRCGYHGLLFDGSGACVEIPGQDRIPPSARVRSFPVVEKYNWIWIWMGEPAKADVSLIPDWWWCDHPEWAFVRPDPLYTRANVELFNDNLLDVTHLAYVHTTSIGTGAITEFPVITEQDKGMVRMRRLIENRPPPPLYKAAGKFTGNVDRGQIAEHVSPCYTVNYAGVTAVGSKVPQGQRGRSLNEITRGGSKGDGSDRKIDLMALSAPSPETDTTTMYYFGFVRNFGLTDPEIDRFLSVDFVNVFREDVDVLEAQQRNITRNPNAPHMDIKVDAAPLAARRMLSQLIDAERSPQSSAAAQ